MNQWNGIVRLTADVELRTTTNGTAVATFTGAVDKYNARELKAQGKPAANFIRFKCFGKRAENIAKYFAKGNQIGITGAIDTGSYDKDGVKFYTSDIIVSDFTFVEKSNKQNTNVADDDFSFGAGSFEDFQQIDDTDDSIPF
jgi:single-strand DNA-binding protein